MPPLRRKVLRDLVRLWPQALAIALVLAAGVATMILGNGAFASLSDTRTRYYDSYRFADVFADVTRAPLSLLDDVRAIDGVLAAEARVVRLALLDLPGLDVPGTMRLVSLSDGAGGLNRLHLRQGRLPAPGSSREIVLSEGFALAQGLTPGKTLSLVLNGQRRDLTVTGIALSPEFIYALGPGEMMPDPRRFGIGWMPRDALAAASDLRGAFSNLVLRIAPGTSVDRVIAEVDRLTAPYGGTGATGRADQVSHAFLDAELKQLGAMVRVLPPIFLLVAAMLVHMTLSRLVTLEREQIGLLKAIGYSSRAIAQHYVEFVLAIAIVGLAIGLATGLWMGAGLAQMYARFFSFPFLVFSRDPGTFALAALVTAAAAVAGALMAVRAVVVLPPAVAMAPPAPASYRSRGAGLWRRLGLRQTTVMTVRHLTRWPGRTLSGVLGVAMAVAILVASLWSFASIDRMIDITFFRGERQDVQMVFGQPAPPRAALAARHMPRVMAAEPFRAAAATIRHRNLSRRVTVTGRPAAAQLSRVLDPDLRPMAMPEAGLILSETLAQVLDVRPGDTVMVTFLEGARRTVALPVSGLSVGYVGLGAAMDLKALHRATGGAEVISVVNFLIDDREALAFFDAAAASPETGFLSVTASTVARFRATLAENITVMVIVYVGLAGIIAVGVIYNFARISLSEQGRELASLRVLGFGQGEVAAILFLELAVIVALAQPLGWAIGYVMGQAMVAAFSSDLYRVPFVIGPAVYATASLVVGAAAVLSALAVWRRIDRLDMIEVLKTRE
ncbi:MAG: FtsX-like permease family protein [Rhodobacteraceae bacterium]|jgi:putative ABC transport system permease protein|nr:FtsX-like permease family protein [Paracoccaceae bacterium]